MRMRPPRIDALAWPESEQWAIKGLNGALHKMANLVGQIEDGLHLFNHAAALTIGLRSQRAARDASPMEAAYSTWLVIAGRDGALRLVDFENAMDGANGYLKDCTALVAKCDRSKIKEAFKALDVHFPNPNRRNIRDAAAHTALIVKNERQRKENSATGGSFTAPGVFLGGLDETAMGDNISGRTYYASFNGTVASFQVSEATVLSIRLIAQTFFSAFPAPTGLQAHSQQD